jgi:hypothetical protein
VCAERERNASLSLSSSQNHMNPTLASIEERNVRLKYERRGEERLGGERISPREREREV